MQSFRVNKTSFKTSNHHLVNLFVIFRVSPLNFMLAWQKFVGAKSLPSRVFSILQVVLLGHHKKQWVLTSCFAQFQAVDFREVKNDPHLFAIFCEWFVSSGNHQIVVGGFNPCEKY